MNTVNNIYTLNGEQIVKLSGYSGVRIDLSSQLQKDVFLVTDPSGNPDGSFDAGDAPFFYQFRRVLITRGEANEDMMDDPGLLEDKVVIVDFGNLFNSIEYVKEKRGLFDIPDDMNKKARDTLKTIDIRFNKDNDYKRFVSFDKSQSMARHSKIMYVSEEYLTAEVKVPVIDLMYPNRAYRDISEEIYPIENNGSYSTAEVDDEPVFCAIRDLISRSIGSKYSFAPDELLMLRLHHFRSKDEDVSIDDYLASTDNIKTSYYEASSVKEYKEKSKMEDLFEKVSSSYYPKPLILSDDDSRVFLIGRKLISSEKEFKQLEKRIRNTEFIKEWNKQYLDCRLMLGLDFKKVGQLTFSKLYAYRGLYLSSSTRIQSKKIKLNEKTVIVVDDKEYAYSKKNIECITNEKTDSQTVKTDTNKIELKNKDIFDGEGLISRTFAKQINSELFGGEKKTSNSFQIRMPYIKGMLHTVDFRRFLNELSGTSCDLIVTDYFGKDRNLRDAEIILTASMFKGADWLNSIINDKQADPMKVFFDMANTFDHALYISGTDIPYVGKRYTTTNYQFLNTLMLSKEDLTELVKEHCRLLQMKYQPEFEDDENEADPADENGEIEDREAPEDPGNDNGSKESDDKSVYESARANERWISILAHDLGDKRDLLMQYEPVRKALMHLRDKYIWDIAYGKLLLPGEIRYLSRDLMLFLKLLAELSFRNINCSEQEKKAKLQKINRQLLSVDDMDMPGADSKVFTDGSCYPVFRNPHLSRNEQCLLRARNSQKGKKTLRDRYLGHLHGVLMVSQKSFVPHTLGGADFDGDFVKIFADKTIEKAVRKGVYKDPVKKSGNLVRKLPIVYINSKKARELPYTFEHIARYRILFDTFSNKVGLISNMAVRRGQKIYASNRKDDILCARCTILTGLEIDACKTGYHPPLNEDFDEDKKQDLKLDYDYLSDFKYVIQNYKDKYRRSNGAVPPLPKPKKIQRKNKDKDNDHYEIQLDKKNKCKVSASPDGSPLTFLSQIFCNICLEDKTTLERLGISEEIKTKDGSSESPFVLDAGDMESFRAEHHDVINQINEYLSKDRKEWLQRITAQKNNSWRIWHRNSSMYIMNNRISNQKAKGVITYGPEQIYKMMICMVDILNSNPKNDTPYPFCDANGRLTEYIKGVKDRIKNSPWPYIISGDRAAMTSELQRILDVPYISGEDLETLSPLMQFECKGYDLLYCLLQAVCNCHLFYTGNKRLRDEEEQFDKDLCKLVEEMDETEKFRLFYYGLEEDEKHMIFFRQFSDDVIIKYLKG